MSQYMIPELSVGAFVSIIAAVIFLLVVGELIRRRFYIFLALILVLVIFVSRVISATFIDVFGPVFSLQLFREVGPGLSTPILVASYFMALIPFVLLLNQSAFRLSARGPTSSVTTAGSSIRLSDMAFWLGSIFVGLLYVDLFRRGVIPAFIGMERYGYTREYAGPLHRWLVEYGNLLAFHLGLFCVYPRIRTGRFDTRFVYLLVALFAYFVLTGNRFSAFFASVSFFLIPFALVFSRPEQRKKKLSNRTVIKVICLILLVIATVAFLLYYSYFQIRPTGQVGPAERLMYRILVEPSELWWVTFERVFIEGEYDTSGAIEFLLFEPFDSTRNSTIQYLMWLAIRTQAISIIDQGAQYAGGYPDILFELFGPLGGFGGVLVTSFIAASLLRLVLRAVADGMIATAFWGIYVFYAFAILYVGGMLNFLVAWTFWVKLSGLLVAVTLERGVLGRPLIPWVVCRFQPWTSGKRPI